MKKSFILSLACILALVSCGPRNSKNSSEESETQEPEEAVQTDQPSLAQMQLQNLPDEPVFDIVTSLGTIRVRLYSDTPKHRDNFAKLALTGYYKGVLFHRVINDFMIQTGDPLTKSYKNEASFGTGGPGYQIEAEIRPNHHHKKGALAAARKGDIANPLKESSGSQFYIVQSEAGCSHLDGEYTIFGETIDGFNVIDEIAKVPTNQRGLPDSPIMIISVDLVRDIE